MKFCASCKQEKTFDLFHKNKSRKDGYNGFCKSCMKNQCARSYERKKPEYLARGQKWREENRDRHNFLSIRWIAENKERSEKNAKNWASNNIHKMREKVARRGAARRQAAPKWLTSDQMKQMQLMYWLALDLKSVSGQEYHVDHIVPLSGKNVCGLHVPWNLQVLPSDLNLSKGRKHEP